jgi:hypothetical protein
MVSLETLMSRGVNAGVVVSKFLEYRSNGKDVDKRVENT